MNSPDFPSDIKQNAERVLAACGGKSLGSYTESQGIMTIREDVVKYIQERDGYPSNPSDIYLCNGASDGIKTVIKLLMNNDPKKPSGIVSKPLFFSLLEESNRNCSLNLTYRSALPYPNGNRFYSYFST